MTAADKLRELLATRPAMPNTEELVRCWRTSAELVPAALADLEAWAKAGQAVVDLFDPMKHRASPHTVVMTAEAVSEANRHLRRVKVARDQACEMLLKADGLTISQYETAHQLLEVGREARAEEPAAGEFYILSLKWTRRSDLITWWCPNNSGYTSILEQAGRYPRAEVEAMPGYYSNGNSTIAIPCSKVDAVAVRAVFDVHLRNLTGKRFERIIEGDSDEECSSCGYSAPGIDVGLRVIGDATEVAGG